VIAEIATADVGPIGQPGSWVGPLAFGLLAGVLDYSAAGPSAIRDRVAVVGYYASAVSFAALLGLSDWMRDTTTAYDWRMAAAIASLITHGALIVVWVGWPKPFAKQLAKTVQWGGAASSAAKINQTLLGWTIAAAITAPMAGDQGWGTVVDGIASMTTGLWSALAGAILGWLGG